MLLLERFRRWKHNRAVQQRIAILHTMEGITIEKTNLGLELLTEHDISLRGSLDLTVRSLHDVNRLLTFYECQCRDIVELGARTEVLDSQLKGLLDVEADRVWLDMWFLYQYNSTREGIDEAKLHIARIMRYRDKLSKGKRQAIDARLRLVLKPLDAIVEHYVRRN